MLFITTQCLKNTKNEFFESINFALGNLTKVNKKNYKKSYKSKFVSTRTKYILNNICDHCM